MDVVPFAEVRVRDEVHPAHLPGGGPLLLLHAVPAPVVVSEFGVLEGGQFDDVEGEVRCRCLRPPGSDHRFQEAAVVRGIAAVAFALVPDDAGEGIVLHRGRDGVPESCGLILEEHLGRARRHPAAVLVLPAGEEGNVPVRRFQAVALVRNGAGGVAAGGVEVDFNQVVPFVQDPFRNRVIAGRIHVRGIAHVSTVHERGIRIDEGAEVQDGRPFRGLGQCHFPLEVVAAIDILPLPVLRPALVEQIDGFPFRGHIGREGVMGILPVAVQGGVETVDAVQVRRLLKQVQLVQRISGEAGLLDPRLDGRSAHGIVHHAHGNARFFL